MWVKFGIGERPLLYIIISSGLLLNTITAIALTYPPHKSINDINLCLGISAKEADIMYTFKAANRYPTLVSFVMCIVMIITVVDLALLTYVLIERSIKDNLFVKTLITNTDLSIRNKKNAISMSGHIASCVMQLIGALICFALIIELDISGEYITPCMNVLFGSVFQFFQVIIVPELRKHIF